jgi:hypothetical protein
MMWTLVAGVLGLWLQGGSEIRVVERGDFSNVEEPRQVAVQSAADWAALWRRHAPDRPQPTVDFSRETVIAVFLGSRPTGGFSVEVAATRVEGGALIVSYRVTSPPRDAITTAVLTFPFAIVAVPRHAGEVRFDRVK